MMISNPFWSLASEMLAMSGGFIVNVDTDRCLYNIMHNKCDTIWRKVSSNNTIHTDGCSSRIGRVQASHAMGGKFDSHPSQANDLANWYLSLFRLGLSINRIGPAQCQDNVTDIGSLFCEAELLVGPHYKVSTSLHWQNVSNCPKVALYVAKKNKTTNK